MASDASAPRQHAEPTAAQPSADDGVSSIDLIIELYKRDVDRSLLIEQLRKTPAQRAEDMQRYHDAAVASRGAARKGSS